MTGAASSSVPAGRVDRVVVAGLLVATTSLLATRVFDRSELLWLPIVVVPLALVAVLPAFRAMHRRVVGYAVIGVAELAVVAYLAGSNRPAVLVDAILRGWPRIVSTAWPSPPRPELVVFVALLVVVAAIGTVELARAGRSAAVTLIPSTVLAVVLVALAAPAGPVPVWWWLIWVTAALLVLLVGDGRPSRGRGSDGFGRNGSRSSRSSRCSRSVRWRWRRSISATAPTHATIEAGASIRSRR